MNSNVLEVEQKLRRKLRKVKVLLTDLQVKSKMVDQSVQHCQTVKQLRAQVESVESYMTTRSGQC